VQVVLNITDAQADYAEVAQSCKKHCRIKALGL
jgi:hypothetical protein